VNGFTTKTRRHEEFDFVVVLRVFVPSWFNNAGLVPATPDCAVPCNTIRSTAVQATAGDDPRIVGWNIRRGVGLPPAREPRRKATAGEGDASLQDAVATVDHPSLSRRETSADSEP
jgi:hypothetical protein